MQQRPSSARQRAPVGRTNTNDFEAIPLSRPKSANLATKKNSLFQKAAQPSPKSAIGPQTSEASLQAKTGVVPIPRPKSGVTRNGETRVPTLYVEKNYGIRPVLPKSRFPTVPPPEKPSPNRYKKPLICPESWLEEDKKPSLQTTLDFAALQDTKLKTKLSREFIEKHVERLGSFNPIYSKMSPQQVCDHMVNHPNFASLIIGYKAKEKSFQLGSSSQIKATFQDDGYNSLGEITNDPYIASYKTPRVQRDSRIESLLAATHKSNMQLVDNDSFQLTRFRRGYKHALEYGNFSAYNGLLVKNNVKHY